MANFINTILVVIATESASPSSASPARVQATLGTMIYWAIQYQALLAERWSWIGAPVVAIVLIFIGLFLLASGLTMRSASRRLGL